MAEIDTKTLMARLAEIDRQVALARRGRDGRDGVDGERGPPGENIQGKPGLDGKRGPAGPPPRPDEIRAVVQDVVAAAVAELTPPRDGKDADPVDAAAHVLRLLPVPKDGAQGKAGKDGTRGPKGDRGDRGPQGEAGPIGPRPDHEWKGTKLRFERANGDWGEFVDLRGRQGAGGGGASTASVTSEEDVQDIVGAMIESAGGTYDDAAGTITLPAGIGSSNSYMPSGW